MLAMEARRVFSSINICMHSRVWAELHTNLSRRLSENLLTIIVHVLISDAFVLGWRSDDAEPAPLQRFNKYKSFATVLYISQSA